MHTSLISLLHTTARRTLSAVVASTLLASSASALDLPRPGPNPVQAAQGMLTADGQLVVLSDRSFQTAETVAVAPVVLAGPSAWLAMGSRLAGAKTSPNAVVTAGAALAELGHETFGFAGRASAGDRALLRVALHLGALQSARALGDATASRRLAASLSRDHAALATLSPKVRAAALGMSRATGATTAAAVAVGVGELMALASATNGRRDPRAHGYLAAGVWAGGALLVASLGGDDSYAMLATPLALQLEKDARFGGVDRKVAGSLKRIAASLRGGTCSGAARVAAVRRELRELVGFAG